MTRRKQLTDNQVAALKPRAKRYNEPDPELVGHYVRVQPSGTKSYTVVARDPYGKQIWWLIGSADKLKIEDARKEARKAFARIKEGLPPKEPVPVKPDSYEAVAKNWIKRHVEAKKLRSHYEIERILNKYVFPEWGERAFIEIKRSDIAGLLDLIEDKNGGPQADATLSIIRAVANWYAKRHDDYISPFVRGMKRAGGARDRVLTDDELRAVWKHAGDAGTFGAFVKLALLTAQRKDKVLHMRWSDISDDGEWSISTEAREKGNAKSVQLPAAALAIIEAQPKLASNPFVLAGRGDGPFNGISRAKKTLVKNSGVSDWRPHDLRRTAKTLLARAGVRPDISERLMGHVQAGVEGIYDRHTYADEKSDALNRLVP